MPKTIDNGEQPTWLEGIIRRLGIGISTDFVGTMTENPGVLPPALITSLAIFSAAEYDRLMPTGRANEASKYLRIAVALTKYIVEQVGADRVIFPQVSMRDESTEGGSLGLAIDPNREYPIRGQELYLLKEVDELRGNQVLKDSREFQGDTNLNLEHILANIPIGNGKSYLWKGFIPGPNLGDLFRTLDRRISSDNETDRTLITQLEKELKGIAIKRLGYWQHHATDLLDQPKDPEAVVMDYKRNFVKVLEGFMRMTDVNFTAAERMNFVGALDKLDWSFMTDSKVTRNLAATYRNMVVATGKKNIDYSRFIKLFTQNGGSVRPNRHALESQLYFVDWANKYSHPLEDAWEMDLSLEGTAKRLAVRTISNQYRQREVTFTAQEVMLMGVYRAYRKAYLILTKFIPEISEQFRREEIDDIEHSNKQARHRLYVNHLLAQGQIRLQRWFDATISPSASVTTIVGTLKRLSDYTIISNNKAGHTQ